MCIHKWNTTAVEGKTRAKCVRCGVVRTWTFVHNTKFHPEKVPHVAPYKIERPAA